MKKNTAEIVAIGSELLLGQIQDTNTPYLASRLQEIGLETAFQTMVGDDRKRMNSVIRRALSRSKVVITTGGIGPTEDDLTREVVAEVYGRKLVFHPKQFKLIKSYFDRAGFVMAPNNRKQAYLPSGGRLIPNLQGTAPGFILETEARKIIVVLPGVPQEMKKMIQDTVLPFLKKKLGRDQGLIEYQVLKVCGLGESRVDDQIGDLIRESTNPVIGLLASLGEIKIRITAHGKDKKETQSIIAGMEAKIRGRLGTLIFGQGEETLEGVATGLLDGKKITLSLVETFTAGRISQRLQATTSPWFMGGLLLASRQKWPFAKPAIAKEAMALFLAEKIREMFSSDLGLAVWMEGTANERTLSLALAGKMEDVFSYRIGGFGDTLPDRVAVLALDWLRKKL
ncbi:MAG: CinA family nicotinamide mononucleotide deamidase-related protein [Thermodesulfobacteriota bacterium]|jgi:nicotinamide-nucleotide amidase